MYVRCQACGVTLDVRDDVARSVPQISCASCGQPVPLVAAGAAVVVPPQAMVAPPPIPASQAMPVVAMPQAAAPGNKTAQYAMAGMGGVVVLLIGVVIALMMGRGGDSGTLPVGQTPVPAPEESEDVVEQPMPEPLPGDLQSQVTARQKEVTALQQALTPLRSDKQRLETEIKQLTDSE